MTYDTLNKLKKDSTFYGNSFKYTVTKVYKSNSEIDGIQAVYTWKNDFGTFCESTYLSKEELLTNEYKDELVESEG